MEITEVITIAKPKQLNQSKHKNGGQRAEQRYNERFYAKIAK